MPPCGSVTCCLGNNLSIVMCPVWFVCPVRASEHEHFMLKSPPPRFIFAMSKKRSNLKKSVHEGSVTVHLRILSRTDFTDQGRIRPIVNGFLVFGEYLQPFIIYLFSLLI